MPSPIIESLKREIEGFKAKIKAEKIGRVLEVRDGIAKISGLSEAASQEMIEVESGGQTVSGIAFNIEEDSIGAIILGDYLKIREGDIVRGTGKVLSIQVGRELVG
ncbi:MAG TPA: F0F1 ATP synthase subunit alpha, partial [Candidatus Paceibacterota bacterium]